MPSLFSPISLIFRTPDLYHICARSPFYYLSTHNVVPDQTAISAAPDVDLQCLLSPMCPNTKGRVPQHRTDCKRFSF